MREIPGLAEKISGFVELLYSVELVVCYMLDTFSSSFNPEQHLFHSASSSHIFTRPIIQVLLVSVLTVVEKLQSKIHLGCNPE
jgi:hypothetical protein